MTPLLTAMARWYVGNALLLALIALGSLPLIGAARCWWDDYKRVRRAR